MSPRHAQNSEDVARCQILDAAETRFREYGYRKTTMAEIADQCSMSAANLYRYFENKQDLAAACAGRCMDERIERLRGVVNSAHPSAAHTLREFVRTTLAYTQEQAFEQPRIAELVAELASARQDLVQAKVAAAQALLADVIAHGNRRGEFDVVDIAATATAIQAALVLFEVPIFAGLYSRASFDRRADQVVDLLLHGLMAR